MVVLAWLLFDKSDLVVVVLVDLTFPSPRVAKATAEKVRSVNTPNFLLIILNMVLLVFNCPTNVTTKDQILTTVCPEL